ncbi:MAG: alpha/beta hydrolase [Pseudomonadota bacterium]
MTPYSQVFGSGPRKALAIHCTMAHSGVWTAFAKSLSDLLTITAMDLPSHGRSPKWMPDQDQHGMATEMAMSLLDAPMDVIGHSYGATVALRLGVEVPHLVRSLTLIEPVFFAAALADEPKRVQAHDVELADYTAAMDAGDLEGAARAFNRLWGVGTRWDDFPKALQDYMTETVAFVPGSLGFLIHDDLDLLGSKALEALPMPVLLVQGERTLDVIDATHAAMARRIPKVQRVTIPGGGHMAPITHPKEVAEEVRSLLGRVGDTPTLQGS